MFTSKKSFLMSKVASNESVVKDNLGAMKAADFWAKQAGSPSTQLEEAKRKYNRICNKMEENLALEGLKSAKKTMENTPWQRAKAGIL